MQTQNLIREARVCIIIDTTEVKYYLLHFPIYERFCLIFDGRECVVGGTEFVIFIVGQTRREYTGER